MLGKLARRMWPLDNIKNGRLCFSSTVDHARRQGMACNTAARQRLSLTAAVVQLLAWGVLPCKPVVDAVTEMHHALPAAAFFAGTLADCLPLPPFLPSILVIASFHPSPLSSFPSSTHGLSSPFPCSVSSLTPLRACPLLLSFTRSAWPHSPPHLSPARPFSMPYTSPCPSSEHPHVQSLPSSSSRSSRRPA